MTSPRKPKLRIVGSEDSPAAKKSPFDDIEALRASTRAAFEAMEAQRPKRESSKRGYLPRTEEEFARAPWYWLKIPAQSNGYPSWVRLHLCLWYRSHEGLEWVPLTATLAAEAGIDRSNKWRELHQLEARGLVEVRRRGFAVPLVRALPYPRGQE